MSGYELSFDDNFNLKRKRYSENLIEPEEEQESLIKSNLNLEEEDLEQYCKDCLTSLIFK